MSGLQKRLVHKSGIIQDAPVSQIDTNHAEQFQLTEKQQAALDAILNGESVFITGPGGVGKSFLTKSIIKELERRNVAFAVTATTGKAAVQIGGQTIHSFCGLSRADKTDEIILRKARVNKYVRNIWNSVDVVIVDEISMLSPEMFHNILLISQKARDRGKDYVQWIFIGDFFQLPPVRDNFNPRMSMEQEARFCFQMPEWDYAIHRVFQLREIFRQTDKKFIEMLDRCRRGVPSNADNNLLHSLVDRPLDVSDNIQPTILHAHNEKVNDDNKRKLMALPERDELGLNPFVTYYRRRGFTYVNDKGVERDITYSHEETETESFRKFTVSTVKREKAMKFLTSHAPCEFNLQLRRGAQVMLIANVDHTKGLVNGTRGVVVGFHGVEDAQLPIVKFYGIPVRYIVGAYKWKAQVTTSNMRSYVWIAQIPLKLAWSYTIHKVQGQSLDKAKITLDNSLFEYGHAYVALSRMRSLDGLTLTKYEPNSIRADPVVVEFYKHLDEREQQEEEEARKKKEKQSKIRTAPSVPVIAEHKEQKNEQRNEQKNQKKTTENTEDIVYSDLDSDSESDSDSSSSSLSSSSSSDSDRRRKRKKNKQKSKKRKHSRDHKNGTKSKRKRLKKVSDDASDTE